MTTKRTRRGQEDGDEPKKEDAETEDDEEEEEEDDGKEEEDAVEEDAATEKPDEEVEEPSNPRVPSSPPSAAKEEDEDEEVDGILNEVKGYSAVDAMDPELVKQMEIINSNAPTSELEIALVETLKRKDLQIERLSGEISKLKGFISKRKQTYKRKRKDEGAPTRALSAYNIYIQDRFAKLSKENEQALKSSDSDAVLKRVPPASLVASTGNLWKELSSEEKIHYEERAREDRKRYEEQMAKYQPPDKQANRKRNKTGYNMFFSAHVLRLKQSESGVPSERGSVARLVGNAWKQLSAEEKQYYEREADKHNGMNPVEKDDDEDDDEAKRPIAEYAGQYAPPTDMQYAAMPPPAHGQAMHQPPPDPRYYHPHGHWGQAPPHGYYEHHAQAAHGAQTPRGAYVQPARGHQHYQYPPQVYHQQPPGRSEYRGSQEM